MPRRNNRAPEPTPAELHALTAQLRAAEATGDDFATFAVLNSWRAAEELAAEFGTDISEWMV